jgi:hypothetical protein
MIGENAVNRYYDPGDGAKPACVERVFEEAGQK